MTDNLYLFVAIFVFSLLVVGLAFTISEFKQMGVDSDNARKKRDSQSKPSDEQ
jgi:hypothetical protein